MATEPQEFDFSAVIANSVHEMKNSLGMLLGGLEEITAQCSPQDCPAYQGFMQLRFEGKRVNNHLIQLLALYRIKNALYSPNITENDVRECLEECGIENEGLLSLKEIALDITCEEDLLWFFDRTMVTSILNSVVNNAYKYTGNRVSLSAGVEGGFLTIAVDDNGPGYPEHMLDSDITPLQEIDLKSGGTGLGIYFAALIAGSHRNKDNKGHIAISNDGIDGGGRFTIRLP